MSFFPPGTCRSAQANEKLCCEGVGCDVGGMGRVKMASFI